jgi:integrase
MAKRFTDITFKSLKPKATRYEHAVDGNGLYVSVKPSGTKRYVGRYRSPVTGKPTKYTFENGISLAAATKLWGDIKLGVAQGRDAHQEKVDGRKRSKGAAGNSLAHVVTRYYQDPRVKALRSAGHTEGLLGRTILPVFGSRPIASIRRSELLTLLDEIVASRGECTADAALRNLSAIFNWWALRDPTEEFRSPIIKGMSPYSPKDHKRERTLDDDEIKALWAATSEISVYNRLLRFLLLTGARREEAAGMTWDEVKDGVWTLPASRNKVGETLERPLSALALATLVELPRIEGCPFAFSTTGNRSFTNWSKCKRALDGELGFSDQWQVHDLRRTARTLLSRVGVANDIAEMCLGHVLPGIRATYDRHKYLEQKRIAFEALAARIERIVNPPPADNVIAIRG